jgi:hypothetical protein
MATCRSCGATVVWVKVNGRPHPCDPDPATMVVSHVVVNPATGNGRVLKADDLEQAESWVAFGATVHRSHFSSCPNAAEHRKAS